MVPAVTSGGCFALAVVSAVSDASWLASVDAFQLLGGVFVQPLIQSYATRSVPFATVIEPHSRNPKDRNARRIGALFSWVSQRK